MTNFVNKKLTYLGYQVFTTKEPTDTEIGKLARNAEQDFTGRTLACLFAADRHQHCKLIQEKLSDGYVVLCDRYLISGLILQSMDSVEFAYTMSLNKGVLTPDMQVILYADNSVLSERLKNRQSSRLELQEQNEGYDRYRQHKSDLEKYVGDITYMPNNSMSDAENIANYIIQQLKQREV
jgi:dTMP kinase